jgi:hypothetical protein
MLAVTDAFEAGELSALYLEWGVVRGEIFCGEWANSGEPSPRKSPRLWHVRFQSLDLASIQPTACPLDFGDAVGGGRIIVVWNCTGPLDAGVGHAART